MASRRGLYTVTEICRSDASVVLVRDEHAFATGRPMPRGRDELMKMKAERIAEIYREFVAWKNEQPLEEQRTYADYQRLLQAAFQVAREEEALGIKGRRLSAVVAATTMDLVGIEGWTAGKINAALDRIDEKRSRLGARFIAEGRGNERPSETRTKTDPLAAEANQLEDDRMALRREIDRRYGPGAPSRLPRGFGPIKNIASVGATVTRAGKTGRVVRRYSVGGERWLLVETEAGERLSWQVSAVTAVRMNAAGNPICPACGSYDIGYGNAKYLRCKGCGSEWDQTEIKFHAMAAGEVACPLCEGTGSEKGGVGGRAIRCRACNGERTLTAEQAERARHSFFGEGVEELSTTMGRGAQRMAVGFLVDGGGPPATLEEMVLDNTGPGVESDPSFVAWLKQAKPGDVYGVAIGGGWTEIRAVAMSRCRGTRGAA